MNVNPKRVRDKLQIFLSAWEQHAPEAVFGKMSLHQFQAASSPTLDTREKISQLQLQIKGLLAARNTADAATKAMLIRVAAGVVSDPDYGINSALYRALNYIPRNERASGLTRKTKAGEADPQI